MVRDRRLVRWLMLTLIAGILVTGAVLPKLGARHPTVYAAGCWTAAVTRQWTDLSLAGSVLWVSVEGKVGLPVVIRAAEGTFTTLNSTGTKPEYGSYVAEFAPLSKGSYFIEPQGLGTVFKVFVDGQGYVRVDFTPLPCGPTPTLTPRPATATTKLSTVAPSTPTPRAPTLTPMTPLAAGWQGRITQQIARAGVYWATIAVRAIGRPAGQEVAIQASAWNATAKTGTKPEFGPDACEFGALNAGTFRLTPFGLDTHLDVTVSHGDFVLVEFYKTGGGQSRWIGSVTQNTSASWPTEHVNSAIAVIVAGRPWHTVEIRAGDFAATCITGYKPEYGPNACEFGGLRAGDYTITPKVLGASVQVTMDGWGWAMVRFDEVTLPAPQPPRPPVQPTIPPAQPSPTRVTGPAATTQPSPTPVARHWQGWSVSNTSGQQKGTGISSAIVVRVINRAGVSVNITGGGGWGASCISGTKPEYGPDACEFGGLWPGTYYLQPEGADIQVEVAMDGLGIARVDFVAP